MLRAAARGRSARALHAACRSVKTTAVARSLDEHDVLTVRATAGARLRALRMTRGPLPDRQRDEGLISIDGYSEYGFVVNGAQFRGGLLAFPSFALMWDVHDFGDITWDSLYLLRVLRRPPGAGRLWRRAGLRN